LERADAIGLNGCSSAAALAHPCSLLFSPHPSESRQNQKPRGCYESGAAIVNHKKLSLLMMMMMMMMMVDFVFHFLCCCFLFGQESAIS
jgi:hypothetical protein